VVGLSLSAAIECAQIWIPGRDPSLTDLLYNGLGTASGVLLTATAAWWLVPARAVAARLMFCASSFAATAICLTSWLLSPAIVDSTIYVQSTPDPGTDERYLGRLIEASVGPIQFMQGRASDARMGTRMRSGEPLYVTAVVLQAFERPATVVRVHDGQQRDLVSLAVDKRGLAFAEQLHATELWLENPSLRLSAMLGAPAVGDTIRIEIRRRDRGYCMALNGHERCGIAFAVDDGWQLLFSLESAPPWLYSLMGLAWLAALFAPIGFWVRRTALGFAAIVIAVVALVVCPEILGLSRTSWNQWAGALAGIVAGIHVRFLVATARAKQNVGAVRG
jgi:hypothetical protein